MILLKWKIIWRYTGINWVESTLRGQLKDSLYKMTGILSKQNYSYSGELAG